MKFNLPLIAVQNLAVSREFYETVLRQRVTLDLGANLTFEDGFALQHDYNGLVGVEGFKNTFGGHDHELYFEEEDFDEFVEHLKQFDQLRYLHEPKEYPWGQRVVRFFDPDSHIIEVGESMAAVFKRFQHQGMTTEQVAERTSHPLEFVREYIQE